MSNKRLFDTIENPAMIYINKIDNEEELAEPRANKQDHKTKKKKEKVLTEKKEYETKSKRKNLLLFPTVFEEGEKRAKELGFKSFNDYINELIKKDCGL